MKVGIIGLGAMGKPIAKHLNRQCDDMISFGLEVDVLRELEAEGAKVGRNLEDMAEVDLLFLCLPNVDIVWHVLFGEGLAGQLKAGSTVVDLGTSSHMKTLELSEKLADMSVTFMDAPISGMQKRAEDGTLTVMCGGDRQDFERLKPFFEMFGSNILHMGRQGAGQLTKLINQLLFDINVAAVAEMLPLAAKLGLDPEQVCKVVNSGTGRSYASEFFVPRILEGNFKEGYLMNHAYKDLISGAEISAHQKIPLPVLAAATTTYQMALLNGYGDLDKGGMVRVFEDLLGVQFRKTN